MKPLRRLHATWLRWTVRRLPYPEPRFGPAPSCCPDAYWCPRGGEVECPRHGGFGICCARPDAHIEQSREDWHEQMGDYERDLLDTHAREFIAARTRHLETPAPASRVPAHLQ